MWLKTSANGPHLLRLPQGLGVGAKGHWEAFLPAPTVWGGPAHGFPGHLPVLVLCARVGGQEHPPAAGGSIAQPSALDTLLLFTLWSLDFTFLEVC